MNVQPLWKDDIWRTGPRVWSTKQVAHICSLKGWKKAREIAEMYGVSKGAICGVWFRARKDGRARKLRKNRVAA